MTWGELTRPLPPLRRSHVGTLISSLMLIAYFLYIYITRLLLDVLCVPPAASAPHRCLFTPFAPCVCSNCAPTDPPDGKLYLQVVFEECGVPGGTQMTLMPWAILGIIFYTVGYPAFIAQVSGRGWIIDVDRRGRESARTCTALPPRCCGATARSS